MIQTGAYNTLSEVSGIFFKKPFQEKWLLIKIVVLSMWIRFMVICLPFRYVAKILGKQDHAATVEVVNTDWKLVHDISGKIKNVSCIVPWDSNCLVQATVGKILLKREKIAGRVHFGVKKEGNKMDAHSWLSVGREIILGGEVSGQYTEVSSFS